MRYLAILLLTPWLLVLCWGYWTYPRDLPRTTRRRIFDTLVLMLAAIGTTMAAEAGFDTATVPQADEFGRVSGAIWQQVFPVLSGYGAFTVVLMLAMLLRHALWGRRRPFAADSQP